MKLLFGWDLDGQCYPETLSGEPSGIGSHIVGTDGLITLLQTQFGIRRPEDPRPVRIAKYLAGLRHIDHGNQFYSISFSADPWSTAEQLLLLRDDLVTAGWNREQNTEDDEILQALSQVERLEIDLYCRSVDGLSELVRTAGKNTTRCEIREIGLATDLQSLPSQWQNLLKHLENRGTTLYDENRTNLPERTDTDLSNIQQHMFGKELKSTDRFRADGSIVLLRAGNEYEAADAVASWLNAGTNTDSENTVIIRGAGVSLLDNACSALGLPRIGGEYTAASRCLAQVLPLCFELCWLPPDIKKLIEFLTLPDSPIPRTVSFTLAQALRHEPGQGNDHWYQAWKNAIEKYVDKFTDPAKPEPAKVHKIAGRAVKDFSYWITPDRFDPETGINTEYVVARTSALRDWAIKRFHRSGEDIYGALATLCSCLSKTVRAAGLASIPRVLFERMLHSVMEEGIPRASGGAEASLWTPIYAPGQLWANAQTVVWWSFVAPPLTNHRLWTSSQIRRFAARGIVLDNFEKHHLREAQCWRNAIRFATKQLLLVFPETLEGSPATIHPLWHEVIQIFKDDPGDFERLVIEHAGGIYDNQTPKLAGRMIRRQSLDPVRPPRAMRDWKIPSGVVKAPSELPVTAIELLISCPFAFVMKHVAKLRASSMLSIPDGDKLIGTFAHTIIAALLAKSPTWSADTARHAALRMFDEQMPHAAAPLLAAEHATTRAKLREMIADSVWSLVSMCQQNGLQVCGVEAEHCKILNGIEINGRIDLVLQDAAGNRFVVDHKWTRSPKYRIAELREDRAIQLAAYAWFESGNSIKYPTTGYHMLRQNEFYTDTACSASNVFCIEGSNPETLWRRTEEGVRANLHNLEVGTITAKGIAPAELDTVITEPVQIEPPCRICDYQKLCGLDIDPEQ